jgi:hypothetical protein
MDKLPVDFATAERLLLGLDRITVLATSAQTGGALFAVEIRMPPGGGPPVCTGMPPVRSITSPTANSPSMSPTATSRSGA